jgi:hypothetical protein
VQAVGILERDEVHRELSDGKRRREYARLDTP